MTSANPFAPPGATTTPTTPAPSATAPYAAPYAAPSAAPGQPYTAQPYTAQPYTAQPVPGQPYQGGPYGGGPYPGQALPGQPYGQPYPPTAAYGPGPLMGAPYGRPAPPRTGLALGSLYTGLGALVIGLPFTVGVGAVAGGLVGLVLGVVALRRVRAGTGGGRAYAWWGIVLSAVASTVGVPVFMATAQDAAEAFEAGWEDGWEDGATGTGTATDGGDRTQYDVAWDDGYDAGYEDGYTGARYPVPAPGTEGSEVDADDVAQLALGEPGVVGVYTVTVLAVSTDADDVVLPAFPGNVEPEGRYIMATVSVTNTGAEPARPAVDLYHYYAGDDDLMYGDWTCASWTPRPLTDVGPLAPGETAEYDVCFDVPLHAVDRPTLLVDDATALEYRLTQWSAPASP